MGNFDFSFTPESSIWTSNSRIVRFSFPGHNEFATRAGPSEISGVPKARFWRMAQLFVFSWPWHAVRYYHSHNSNWSCDTELGCPTLDGLFLSRVGFLVLILRENRLWLGSASIPSTG